jgi:4-hydroxybutyrate CoA-transferase
MGKRDLTVDWRSDYDRKLVSPEEAAASVQSGDHVWWPPAHGSPAFLAALAARRDELRDVEVRGIIIPDAGWFTTDSMEAFHIASQFASLFDRHAIESKVLDYHPYWLVGIHKALDAGRSDEAWPIDKLIIVVSPPNERGFVSLGGSVWDGVTSVPRSRTVIAEVNPNVIETFGDSWLHVSEIDYFIADDRPVVPDVPGYQPEALDYALAAHVAELVKDGDTIQVGVGSHSGSLAMAGAFDEKQELNYFAELTVPGIVPLVERGIITGRTSQLHPNRAVATVMGNTVEERQAVHRNPHYELYGIEYLLDPRVISKNEGIVAINGALTVDLSGQIGVHTIGRRVYAGVGGHLAFALGAYLAPRGRYVTVLPSTAMGGTVSTITPEFEPGQIVTVPRDIADTVVTEHGIARLLGKTVRQRADELISVAHPDFRGELRKAAKSLFYP